MAVHVLYVLKKVNNYWHALVVLSIKYPMATLTCSLIRLSPMQVNGQGQGQHKHEKHVIGHNF
jgi:hypothetical protein